MEDRFRIARPDIVAAIDATGQRIFTRRELARVMREHQKFWRLPVTASPAAFIALLERDTPLRKVKLTSKDYASVTRYVWRNASDYELALSVRPDSYLSHGTAAFLHALNDQIPKTIYVNKEQSPKPPPEKELEQSRIDTAFKRTQRESRLVYEVEGGARIRVLSGKHTGNLEVAEMDGPSGEPLLTTKLERTLIDITVRPTYAGGIDAVLEAYITTAERPNFSVGVLLSTLRKLDYAYPYHQAIGFYMQRAGFPQTQQDRLRKLGLHYDFYLAHGLGETAYVPEWRLHVPVRFQTP